MRARNDLDWLPPSFKAIRWTVAGTLWTGMAGLLGGALMFAKPGLFIYGKGIAVLFAGGYYAGDKAARAVLRSRLSRLAHGRLDLSRLKREADGELVHVRGRVKARQAITGLLDGRQAVYRRVVFAMGAERWVHEAGEDFHLVDETGERVLIEVGDARLIAVDGKRGRVEGELARQVFELTLEPQSRNRTDGIRISRKDKGAISCGEVLVQEGDEVEVVGYKNRSVDLTVESRLERDIPMRATLRAGKDLPLLISPVR